MKTRKKNVFKILNAMALIKKFIGDLQEKFFRKKVYELVDLDKLFENFYACY